MNTEINNSIAINKEVQEKITPEEAINLLKEGNRRFRSNNMLERDLFSQIEQTSNGQYPFAAVLSCIDSRVPVEMIFDQGIGDLFSARIAGNFVNEDILGSLEFACKVAGAKVIVVLGHTSCGAIKGACDDVKLGNLTGMLEKIKPAIDALENNHENRTSSNPDFVRQVTHKNIQLTLEAIKRESHVLNQMIENKEIAIVGGIYDVNSGKVDFDLP